MRWSSPLLVQEIGVLLTTPSLWWMLAALSMLVGYSFIQAANLYSEASRTALQYPQLASAMNPTQGVFVPLFGAYYLVETLLLPFVVIRLAGEERQSGALKLLLQQPLSPLALNGTKLLALLPALLALLLPALSAMLAWHLYGGFLHPPELATLLLGHLLYTLVIACVALFATAVSDSLAAAAMICLGVTLGNWVLDFAASGQDLLARLSPISLTAPLREMESGLLSGGDLAVLLGWALLFFLAGTLLLHPGKPLRRRLLHLSLAAVLVPAASWALSRHPFYLDVTENHLHSFAPAEEQALKGIEGTLKITIHMARSDSRVQDLERKVLGKLRRSLPRLEIVWAETGDTLFGAPEKDNYGLIEYDYRGKHDQSYSTSEHEILPIIHNLAGLQVTSSTAPPAQTGHPLVADASPTRVWFYLVLPAVYLALGCWFRCRPGTFFSRGNRK